ncbi:MAG: VWA domain-containing protein, partial [Proteobacteria bacterium]
MSFSFHPLAKREDPGYDVSLEKWPLVPNSQIVNIDLGGFVSAVNFTNLDLKITLASGYVIEKSVVRHVDFCPGQTNYCINNNPRGAIVRQLFLDLINHLHQYSVSNTVPDGYSCPALTALAPYVTDKDPLIYAFGNTNGEFHFSFHKPLDGEKWDVALLPWQPGSNTGAMGIDLSAYNSPAYFTPVNGKVTLQNGSQIARGEIRHVNFCPDDLCVNHVVIVVDESSSLDELEKRKIRKQLNHFFLQQKIVNEQTNGNMYLSLIGMSDQDSNVRGDNVLERRIDATSISDFQDWIASYGTRYGVDDDGISKASDYWQSGLSVALASTRKPDIVIMITDGCETSNAEMLKTTMMGFDNYYGNAGTSKPHLYVIGIDEGFYVYDNALYANSNLRPGSGFDPNSSPAAASSVNSVVTPEGNVTSNLALSLKYLLGYPGSQFPASSVSDFNADYFPHTTFKLLGDDVTYLSDRIILAGIGCGEPAVKNPCDDCFSFQPEPGKSYVLSAWVKEEHSVQVESYPSPKITINFKSLNEQPLGHVDCMASGPVIEGWQRIVQKFEAPSADTAFMQFQLINQSQDVPVFFDDIRIYPVSGSMKSFVYDPENFKLMSELDDNNFATYYE